MAVSAGSPACGLDKPLDRKSTRLNSSHQIISYAVFCLKKKIRVFFPSISVCLSKQKGKKEISNSRERNVPAPLRSHKHMNENGVMHESVFIFFFNDTATTETYTLSLHDALPIYGDAVAVAHQLGEHLGARHHRHAAIQRDRKSTRLNSSHQIISYAVFCLKK